MDRRRTPERSMFSQRLVDEDGTTNIEYGLIAALVGVALIVAMTALGDTLEALFTDVSSSVDSAVSG